MMKRIALLATILAVGYAAVARATIVINTGVFGVHLGESMTEAQNKLAALGAPIFSGVTAYHDIAWFYGHPHGDVGPKLVVRFGLRTHRVFELDTSDPQERTANGVGPGTSLQVLLQRIPGLQCVFGAGPNQVTGQCRVQAWKNGKTYETWFDTTSRRWGSGNVVVVTVDVWPFIMHCHVMGAVTTLHHIVNRQGMWDCPGAYTR